MDRLDEECSLPALETERLALRPLAASDEAFLIELDTDPLVMQYVHTGPLTQKQAVSLAQCQIEAMRYRRFFGRWMVVDRRTQERLGWMELHRLSGPAGDDLQAGYQFAPRHWNQGYATESLRRLVRFAFEERRLSRVGAMARAENAASNRVLEKCGFVRTDRTELDGAELPCIVWFCPAPGANE